MRCSVIETNKSPAAVGAYSQGVSANGFVFTAGQIPLNPETNQLLKSNIDSQINQIFKNLDAICLAGNSSIKNAVKLTVFVTDLSLAPNINKVINKWFTSNSFPARSMVQVSKLPLNSKVEIECIATQNK